MTEIQDVTGTAFNVAAYNKCSDFHCFPFFFELTHESTDSARQTRSILG
jgi:hypothetical protein